MSAALLLLALLVLAAAWLGVRVVIARRRLRAPASRPQLYGEPVRPGTFSLRPFVPGERIDRVNLSAQAQPESWCAGMREVGEVLARADVRRVVFVHGTFVGDDPFTLVRALGEQALQAGLGGASVIRAALAAPSKLGQLLLRDVGQFSPEYVSLFENGLGGRVVCSAFKWSSANHHVARLQAAGQLACALAEQGLGSGRVLFFAHSHGGQVLALLTQLLHEPESRRLALLDILRALGPVDAISNALDALRRARFDVVTLGTPPRYGWPALGGYRLLHLINHRGRTPQGGDWAGAIRTLDGDYIQQWGIAGSDLPATTRLERDLNIRLDALLGDGADPRAWMKHIRHRTRVHDHGHTMLIDYGDKARGPLPNGHATLFGHGVYTTYEAMLFQATLAAEYFHEARAPGVLTAAMKVVTRRAS